MKETVKIKTKLLHGANLPFLASAGAAGADLTAVEDCHIQPGERELLKTGVCIELPQGYGALVMGRSGNTTKLGMHVAMGLIDSDYRGPIGVMAFNQSDKPICIPKGSRIAQLVILPIPAVEYEQVEELTLTERGAHGFGSTG